MFHFSHRNKQEQVVVVLSNYHRNCHYHYCVFHYHHYQQQQHKHREANNTKMKEGDKSSTSNTASHVDDEKAFLRQFAAEIGAALREKEDATNDPIQD